MTIVSSKKTQLANSGDMYIPINQASYQPQAQQQQRLPHSRPGPARSHKGFCLPLKPFLNNCSPSPSLLLFLLLLTPPRPQRQSVLPVLPTTPASLPSLSLSSSYLPLLSLPPPTQSSHLFNLFLPLPPIPFIIVESRVSSLESPGCASSKTPVSRPARSTFDTSPPPQVINNSTDTSASLPSVWSSPSSHFTSTKSTTHCPAIDSAKNSSKSTNVTAWGRCRNNANELIFDFI
jgi:hypothetical protein